MFSSRDTSSTYILVSILCDKVPFCIQTTNCSSRVTLHASNLNTKNKFRYFAISKKSCSAVQWRMSSLLALVVQFVCDHTPRHKTWLAVLWRVWQDDETKH